MSQSQRFAGFVGQSYNLKNWNYDCQRTINRYVEFDETGHGKDAEPAQLAPCPGLTSLISGLDSGGSRGGWSTSTDKLYWVFGNTLYLITGVVGSATGWSATSLGTISGTGPCKFSDNGVTMFIVTGPIGAVYAVTLANSTLAQMDTTGYGGGNVIYFGYIGPGSGYTNGIYYNVPLTGGSGTGCIAHITVTSGGVTALELVLGGVNYTGGDVLSASTALLGGVGGGFSVQVVTIGQGWQDSSSCAYIDGYVIFTHRDTNQFFWTDLYSQNIIGFASAETNPDHVTGIISNNEDIWIFGETTTEVWYNLGGGTTGNEIFQRRAGLLVETGGASPYTIQKLSNSILWVASDNRGGAMVMMANGYSPTRVSTFAIEQLMQTVNSNQLKLATADAYQWNGHFFYSINIPGIDSTLVFDLTAYQLSGSPQWHERQSGYGLKATRHIAEGHVYFNGKHITGNYASGDLYFYDINNNTDAGALIARTRVTPHVSNGLKRMRYVSLQIDYTAGTLPELTSFPGQAIPSGTYATWNPADKSVYNTLSNGDLTSTITTSFQPGGVRALYGKSSGKWYWEDTIGSVSDGSTLVGVATSAWDLESQIGEGATSWAYRSYDGNIFHNMTNAAYGPAYGPTDVISTLLDMDAGTLTYWLNGANLGVAYNGVTGTIYPGFSNGPFGATPGSTTTNFGATAFVYTPPSGYAGLTASTTVIPTTPTTPQVMLQYSDDGGKTWSSERWLSLGGPGQYRNRIIYYKLGVSRNRVFRIVDVNNCYSGISGAELTVEPGAT